MKKLLAFLLLLVLLPAAALGEAASDTVVAEIGSIAEIGSLSFLLSPDDSLELGEQASGQVMAIISVPYDDGTGFLSNINVTWLDASLLAFEDIVSEEYASSLLDTIVATLAQQGLEAGSPSILSQTENPERFASQGYNSLLLGYCYNVDYSPLGVDLAGTVYQQQLYLFLGDRGTYIVTASAMSPEALTALGEYLESLSVTNP